MLVFSPLIVFFCLVFTSNAWPSGAPEKTCSTLKPIHGTNIGRLASESPFSLTQSHQDYKPGEKVRGKTENNLVNFEINDKTNTVEERRNSLHLFTSAIN